MTHSALRRLAAVALALAAAPSLGLAAPRGEPERPPAAAPASDELTAQEREMLALAQDLSARCAAAFEKWLAAGEVSEDRLFNELYYPIPDTEPVKFHTDWDRLADRDLPELQEAALARFESLLYAVFVDRHGYLPTHNRRYAQPLTGDRAVDLVNNRTKRMFNNHVEIKAARNTRPYLFQQYFRDNGDVLEDLGVPVIVRGRHLGAIRVGFRPVRR